jgi:hypothetical protein
MITLHGIDIKIGDNVFDIRYGWSKVIELDDESIYKIVTNFNSYTIDGKYHIMDSFPILFWNEFEVPKCVFIKPLPDLKIDTKVLVWNGNGRKEKRYFSHFDKYGNMRCFNNGVTGWINKNAATTAWDKWELYEKEG